MRFDTLPKVFFVPLLALTLLVCEATAQTIVQLPAAKDNTLYENATGSLSNGVGQHFFAGVTREEFRRRGLLFFNIAAAIPAAARIDSVKLTLHMSQTTAGEKRMTLHRVLKDWGEGTTDAAGQEGAGGPVTTGSTTWIHTFYDTTRWEFPGGDFAAAPSDSELVGGIGFYTWGPAAQLAADVQSWLDNAQSNSGWILLGDENAPSTAKRFASRENTVVAQRPVLTVAYTVTAGVEEPKIVPAFFALEQNYPNPFNPETIIRYTLSRPGWVELQVFSLTGQVMKTLVNGIVASGSQRAEWDGTDDSGRPVPSGVYIYRLKFAGGVEAKRMTLLR